MVQRTKIFFTLVLKRFTACSEMFLSGFASQFLRRKICVAQPRQVRALTDA
jgi:hypothetical protein